MTTLTIELPDSLKASLEREAARSGASVQSLVLEGIESVLAHRERQESIRRFRTLAEPVRKATEALGIRSDEDAIRHSLS